jgi:predicted AAA+ superfamily ATPase
VRENTGYALYYWREGNDEVDFVLKHGDKTIALEIKSGRKSGNGANLTLFTKKFPASKTLLVGGQGFDFNEFLQVPIKELFNAVR